MGSKRRLDGILVGFFHRLIGGTQPFQWLFCSAVPRWPAEQQRATNPAILFASIDRDQIVTIRVDIVQRRSSTVPDCCAYMSEQSTLLVFSSLWVSCWVMALLPPGGTTRQHIRGTQGDLRGHLTVTTGLFGVGQVYTLNKLHQIPWNQVEFSEILRKIGLPFWSIVLLWNCLSTVVTGVQM